MEMLKVGRCQDEFIVISHAKPFCWKKTEMKTTFYPGDFLPTPSRSTECDLKYSCTRRH